ncbi:hypothetical protein GCM10023238_14190 [Streptomyces heliomycini]
MRAPGKGCRAPQARRAEASMTRARRSALWTVKWLRTRARAAEEGLHQHRPRRQQRQEQAVRRRQRAAYQGDDGSGGGEEGGRRRMRTRQGGDVREVPGYRGGHAPQRGRTSGPGRRG